MKPDRAKLTLLLIFALFAAPVLIAILMHSSWWHYQPAGMTNLGTLVEPPRPLDYSQLELAAASAERLAGSGNWVILYPVESPCREACLRNIESLRQIHKASGRHQQQLQLLLLTPPTASAGQAEELLEVYDAFLPGRDRHGDLNELLLALGDVASDGALVPGQAFLVDPAGNIMMRYTAGFDPNHLNKDLKRLLKLSAQDG